MENTSDTSKSCETTHLVLVANDLMFQSKISAACKSAGVSLQVLRKPQIFASDFDWKHQPSVVIVDLGLADLDLDSFYAQVRAALPTAKVLCYGAHVLADRLEQASALGLDAVLTRGQFDRDMLRIIQSVKVQ
ncbi:MAG: hypothetical protein ACKOAU_04285 [Pirellula sp.]